FDKPWALTGAKGRSPNKIASLKLVPDHVLEEMNLSLDKTYQEISKKECRHESYLTEDAEYLLVAYGTSSRLCRAAVNVLREEGIKAGLFRLITAWPFPADALRKASSKAKKILTVEMSLGQMIEDVKLSIKNPEIVDFYGRSGGMLPETDEIVRRIKAYGN
ncbi:MAG: 3-methyl-2-oxobutanoate dehydrogenase subunit beta, partial [Spirochaetales bacterium]|nr:3-methyl-2-oxobutanoate dehydrogenase subunit beta [Spirochaetales bacterium]